jgi:hypothetical protein
MPPPILSVINGIIILLNLATGGNFGRRVYPLFFTSAMEVDYVRVFQR